MGLTESLYDYVLNSGNPALQPDHLYQCARLWGRCFWGDQYPDQEVMDDNENYRGLELIHIGMVLRHVTWRVAIGNPIVPGMTSESLFQEMMNIRNVFLPSYPPCFPCTNNNDLIEILGSIHHRQIGPGVLGLSNHQHHPHGRGQLLRAGSLPPTSIQCP